MNHLSYYILRDKTMTTQHISKKKLMYVGGAAVLLAGVLVGVVQLSEYNQMRAECTELEREIRDGGEEIIFVGERMQQLEQYADTDPWGALNYLDEALEISLTTVSMVADLTANVEKYEDTCPVKRQQEFKNSKEMRAISERLDQLSK